MAAEFERDASGAKRLQGCGEAFLRLLIRRGYDSAKIRAKLRRCDAGSREPNDQHALSFQFESRSHSGYLSFKVVSENSAKTSAKIQKRTIIFDSLQPISSK